MDYTLQQRGRASIDFLADVRSRSDRLEAIADERAIADGLDTETLPDDPDALQKHVAPRLEAIPEFRLLKLCRDWTLEQHGLVAIAAFEEIRDAVSPQLDALQSQPNRVSYADDPPDPDYWHGVEFHKSAGGWDGHDYMGFVHGELIHRRMVNPNFFGLIYATRKSVAEAAPLTAPERILEIGCCSGQYTQGVAEVFPDAELWACDLSPRQLEQAQRYANEHGLNWRLFQADGAATGQPDDHFDLVTSYAMFHEIPTAAARDVLQECLRVTKPGGYTVIGDVKAYHAYDNYSRWKNDYWNQVHGGDPHWREYAVTDLAALALEAGFSEASWQGLGEHHYPYVLIARKAG
ncbi:MAG: class I SAM-dependent methyltransferase [Gammaproteobacteria bacterium]|nr:class I SAM-dependent methyltransferase [Gammaproteobacteria bacterium]NND55070.1 class I SAM-dependent methyltransferase [Gammaproteobacteria bacterium]